MPKELPFPDFSSMPDSGNLNTQSLRQQFSLFNMPVGLPQCIPLQWLTNKITEDGNYSRIKNRNSFKRLKSVIKDTPEEHRTRFPIDQSQVAELSERNRLLVHYLAYSDLRHEFSTACEIRVQQTLPSLLINLYTNKRYGHDFIRKVSGGANIGFGPGYSIDGDRLGPLSLMVLALTSTFAQRAKEGPNKPSLTDVLDSAPLRVSRTVVMEGVLEDAF